jgi:hypothetical protein
VSGGVSPPRSLRIVSGGQTGVDRAALDAAQAAGVPCGGWCPAGRRAEDGAIPARYPLRETAGVDCAERTRRNIEDSDGTLVIGDGPAQGGTALTIELCRELGRPLLQIDAAEVAPADALSLLLRFLAEREIRVLNVAGPRASQSARAGEFAGRLLSRALSPASPAGRGPARIET